MRSIPQKGSRGVNYIATDLVQDERGRGFTTSGDERLQLFALDDLTSGITRVGRNDDLEALSANVALDLVHV